MTSSSSLEDSSLKVLIPRSTGALDRLDGKCNARLVNRSGDPKFWKGTSNSSRFRSFRNAQHDWCMVRNLPIVQSLRGRKHIGLQLQLRCQRWAECRKDAIYLAKGARLGVVMGWVGLSEFNQEHHQTCLPTRSCENGSLKNLDGENANLIGAYRE